MQNIHVSKSSGFSNFPFPSIFKIFLLVEKYLRNCLKPKYFFENCLPKIHWENIHEKNISLLYTNVLQLDDLLNYQQCSY